MQYGAWKREVKEFTKFFKNEVKQHETQENFKEKVLKSATEKTYCVLEKKSRVINLELSK